MRFLQLPLTLLTLTPSSTVSAADRLLNQQQPLFDETVSNPGKHDFELKHIFHRGSSKFPLLHRRLDLTTGDTIWRTSVASGLTREEIPHFSALGRQTHIQRLRDRRPEAFNQALGGGDLHATAWAWDELEEPDVTDKETVLAFARMSNDAYYTEPGDGDWQDIGGGFNYTEDFGWESDGLRGHIFADVTNKTLVIAMKGTSLPFIDPRDSITNDKINDNLLFSCCCGQGGRWLWHNVCQCQTDTNIGNATCLANEIREKSRYYHLAKELYFNVTELYPEANVWLAGHSLGGSVASLLGLTVGQPVVTFEAPADAIAAHRLGLPTPPKFRLGKNDTKDSTESKPAPHHPTYHFGHTADDIFMGNCNAWNSVCTLGGYAMESKCHTGAICTYDTVKDKGWSPNARANHGIGFIVNDVIDTYPEPAECKAQTDCRDCEDWTFFHDEGSG